jgi:hypothetical protein
VPSLKQLLFLEVTFPSGSQVEGCCEGSLPPTSHLCAVSVVNVSVPSETMYGVCCLEIGNQRLTLNLNSPIVLVIYFHEVFLSFMS